MVQPRSRHASGAGGDEKHPKQYADLGYLPVHPGDLAELYLQCGDRRSACSSESTASAEPSCCVPIPGCPDDPPLACDKLLEFAEKEVEELDSTCRSQTWVMVSLALLTLANFLNYVDRYTIAGVLPDIQTYYSNRSDGEMGLLQTAFIVFYMLCSPVFGYLGDRFNRTYLMAGGIAAWSIITLLGSFVPARLFWLFVFMRAMVGVGEASYSTIAPTIIADLFVADKRTNALSVFYFAIPVGSGLGYIIGAQVAQAMGAWQWALRVTPVFGIVCAVLILVVVKEPVRGQSEGATHESHQSWGQDLLQLARNKSFVFSTFGFTAVAFVAGALSFWAPTFMAKAMAISGAGGDITSVSFKFGIITVVAGILGVVLGSQSARLLRHRFKRADPLVCAFGLVACAPFLYLAIVFASIETTVVWVLIFIGETLLCLNWAVVTDILLYIVPPTCRSTAEAAQILTGHLLGDAGSPYLVGVVSDWVSNRSSYPPMDYYGLQTALYMMAFVAVLGGGCFLATAIYILEDRKKAEVVTKALASNSSANVLVSETETDDRLAVERVRTVDA